MTAAGECFPPAIFHGSQARTDGQIEGACQSFSGARRSTGRHLTQVKQFMGIKKEKNNKKKKGLSACTSDGVKPEIYSLERSKAQAGISGQAAQIVNGLWACMLLRTGVLARLLVWAAAAVSFPPRAPDGGEVAPLQPGRVQAHAPRCVPCCPELGSLGELGPGCLAAMGPGVLVPETVAAT